MKIQVASKVYKGLIKGLAESKTILSLQGSSRSGKTVNILIFLITYILEHNNTRLSIVRKTLPALKGSVLIDFKEILFKMDIWNDKQFNKTELIYKFNNGSWVEFFSTDDEQKIRGRKRGILFANEANELSYLEWQQLIMRTTLFAVLDYNPSFSEDHWIESVNKDPDCYHFISTYNDNPFLEQKIIDDIEKLQGKNKSLWTVYGLGLRAVIEGRIFDDYEIVEGIPEHIRKRWVGMDFGYTNDPTAILNVAIDGEDLYMDEICYRTKMLTNDIIKVLKSECQNKKIISESADPRLIDEIHNAGLNIHAVEKFQGSINAGLAKMKEYNLKITKRSTNIKKEIDNYVYDQDKEGRYLNQPVDEFNHCFVSDTKIITKEGIKNICDIKTSDDVLTSEGFSRVIKLYHNGLKQVNNYSIQFDMFSLSLHCTEDHLIKTTQGWEQISQLESGMQVFLSKHLMGKHTDFIQENDTFQEEQNGCMSQSGNFIMAKFLRGLLFIIKTKIHGIINPKILKLKKSISICQNMGSRGFRETKNGLINFIMRVLKKQKNGMVQKKEENGTQNIVKKDGRIKDKKRLSVNFAEENIKQDIQEYQNTVIQTVKQKHCVKGEKMQVFDIHVEGVHEYFANGILVHNSIDAGRYVILEEVIGHNRKKTNLSSLLGKI
ncbi:MAG TPA: phage terminase large subunit [Patescibacteria group bacterium]|nr:phage terminase large subunit [Patescibacteria group bacterium]